MDINKNLNRGMVTYLVVSLLFGGCAKFATRDFYADKPQGLIDQEALDTYLELKTYVDYSNQPNFKLGAELRLVDVSNNSVLYRLMQRHVDEISITTSLDHMNMLDDEGNVTLRNLQAALENNDSAGMPVHAGHLVWHERQQAEYLDGLIADLVLPGNSGSDVVVNFESDEIGKTYSTTSDAATATVITDPDGESGNVLHILKNPGNAFPQFNITLPEGRKLGQYISVVLDFKGDGCCGFYGAGMRMAITTELGDPPLTGFGGPSSFGIPINQWGRGLMILPIAGLNLTPQQKELTSFVLTIGSQTGAPDYLIDNITMNWEIEGETIVKTPEEKREIITGELEKWIAGVVETGKSQVKSWSVVYQPMDDSDPSELRSGLSLDPIPANTFYWQDYLGKEYAATAINLARQYGNPDDKIFITETNLLANPAKVQGFADFIAYTEGKGASVDGIATELALDIDSDKTQVEGLLESLAATGKLIKISAVDIGVGVNTSQATAALYQRQADMYKYFVETYFALVPASQRAGITFRSPIDQGATATWRPNEPVGLWRGTGGYLRKPAYAGVAEALQ